MKIKYIKEAAHVWLLCMPKGMFNDIKAAAKNIRAAAKHFYIALEYLASFLIILLMWLFPTPIILVGAKSLENMEGGQEMNADLFGTSERQKRCQELLRMERQRISK